MKIKGRTRGLAGGITGVQWEGGATQAAVHLSTLRAGLVYGSILV